VKVSNFFARVSSPVLSDIEIDMGGVETEFVYPRKPGDLFKGMQLVMIGRYRNANDLENIVVLLRGRAGGESRSFSYDNLDFPLRNETNDFLPRIWASRRVGWLIEQIRLNGETRELKDEVVELGTRYGIVTPYTSYLATDGSLTNTRDQEQLSRLSAGAPAKMNARSGADAVQMSVQQNSMQMNTTIVKNKKLDAKERVLVDDSVNNQFFANKNFFNQNKVWIDSDYSADSKLPEVRLKFASEEYFKVAVSNPELARYFSLGEEVVVVWRNQVYRVSK
jgi:Ca-activated chloride channel family protein